MSCPLPVTSHYWRYVASRTGHDLHVPLSGIRCPVPDTALPWSCPDVRIAVPRAADNGHPGPAPLPDRVPCRTVVWSGIPPVAAPVPVGVRRRTPGSPTDPVPAPVDVRGRARPGV